MRRALPQLAFALVILSLAAAAAIVDPKMRIPFLSGQLVDDASLLSPEQTAQVDSALSRLNSSAKAQMAVLIVSSLNEFDIESYAAATFEQWKLGKKGEDRGLLLLIAPNERKLRWEVGDGLEGELTDVETRRFSDRYLTPFFREGRYGEGLAAAIDAVGAKLGVEASQKALPEKVPGKGRRSRSVPIVPIFLFIVIFLIILRSQGGGGGGSHWGGGRRYQSWDSGGWGGGWGGGGGSSGWGGFGGGGGRSSGGGSSSSW